MSLLEQIRNRNSGGVLGRARAGLGISSDNTYEKIRSKMEADRQASQPTETEIQEQKRKREEQLRKMRAQYEANLRVADEQARKAGVIDEALKPANLFGAAKKIAGGTKDEIQTGAAGTMERMRGQVPTETTKTSQFLFPTRGFEEQELQVEPTLQEKAIAPVRFVAEMASIVPAVGDVAVDYLTKRYLGKDPVPKKETDPFYKLARFSEPKTAGEAKAMRMIDVAGVLPTSFTGKIKAISRGMADILEDLAVNGKANIIREVASESVSGKLSDKTKKLLTDEFGDVYANKVDQVIRGEKVSDVATRAVPMEDQRNMNDLINYAYGDAKLSNKNSIKAEFLMAELREKYNLPERKSLKATANDFGKILDKQGFEPYIPPKADEFRPLTPEYQKVADKPQYKRDEVTGRFAGSEKLDTLTQEAKNFKTADEFVKAQGTPLYRGGSTFDEVKMTQEGTSFSTKKEIAQRFDDMAKAKGGTGKMEEMILSPTSKVLKMSDVPNNLKNSEVDIVEYARKKGYDAVDFGKQFDGRLEDEIRIINPKVIKTKSQLIDIWNKAQGKEEFLGAFAGVEIDDEGNMKLDPTKAIMGVAGMHIAKKPAQKIKVGIQDSQTFNQARAWLSNNFLKAQETIQDDWIRFKKLQDQGKIENIGFYEAEKLYHGRVDTRINQVKDEVQGIVEKIVKKKIDKNKVNSYLIAKHAPERNKALGDGAAGITDSQADEVLKELKADKGFKEIQAVADEIASLNKRTLEILKDGQLITPELFDELRTKYPNHIPLQRIMEGDDFEKLLAGGKSFDVKTSGLKRAKGSEREVADILENVNANVNEAIIRSEKNRVVLSIAEFINNNQDFGAFKLVKKKAVGQTFDGKTIFQEPKGKGIISFFEKGEKKYLEVTDHKMAEVIQGMGMNQVPAALRWVSNITRMMAGLATRFNPDFAFSNLVRDSQEMAIYMASQKNIGFTGAAKTTANIGESGKAVADHIFGRKTEGARLYQQMLEDGGSTGGLSLATKKQVQANIKTLEKIAKNPGRKGVEKALNVVDNWNKIFEDSNRLSAYKTALSRGMTREQAAVIAKDSTINFNKKGKAGSLVNSFYMFANASIQGSAKMVKAMKNPKVAAAVSASVVTTSWTVNKWNDTIDPDWRNKVTKWDKNANLTIMLPSDPNEPNYITIPVSWGLKPFKILADSGYEAMSGIETDVSTIAGNFFAAAVDGYNPLGGHDLTSALTPTILDIPSDIKANTAWHGGAIKPDYKKGLPKAEQVFGSTEKEAIGGKVTKLLQAISEKTNRKIDFSPEDVMYVGSQILSGAGAFVGKVAHTVSAVGGDSKVQLRKVPFVGRFVKDTSADRIDMAQKYSTRDEFLEDIKQFKTGSPEQKKFIKEFLLSLPDDEERKSVMFVLRDGGVDTKGIKQTQEMLEIEPVFDKVKMFMEAEDLESAEKIVGSLTDDEYEAYKKYRASYRSSNMSQLREFLGDNPEEAVKFVRDIKIPQERQRLLENLEDEEWKIFETAKNNYK